MDNFEKTPFQIASESINNRQESLQRQLNQLDNNQSGERVLGEFLSQLYLPKNYERIDDSYSQWTNIRYQPKAALSGQVTHGDFGDSWGFYEYKPITEAVKEVKDYFDVFPEIEKRIKQSNGEKTEQLVKEISQVITDITNIPVVFSNSKSVSERNSWRILSDKSICDSRIREKIRGLHVDTYPSTPGILQELEERGFSKKLRDQKPIGNAIILNDDYLDDPFLIQTCTHELGHIAENRFILPQKEIELKETPILNTEVISTLYGLKTAMLMAALDPDTSFKIMNASVSLYNWILTGTTAP